MSFKIIAFILATAILAESHGSVLRTASISQTEQKDLHENTTLAIESTTAFNDEAAVTTEGSGDSDKASNEKPVIVVEITEEFLDPAPTESAEQTHAENEEVIVNGKDLDILKTLQKSSKLLLLSAPKNVKEPEEENIEEPAENEATTVQPPVSDETTTAQLDKLEDNKEESEKSKEEKSESEMPASDDDAKKDLLAPEVETTKLAPINDTNTTTVKNVNERKSSPTSVALEWAPEPKQDNVASEVLYLDTSAGTGDYVVLDADCDEAGSFTHVDSDLHLQPIVESVEVVPTHVDAPLLANYVHSY